VTGANRVKRDLNLILIKRANPKLRLG
jgi:hypothetical protein